MNNQLPMHQEGNRDRLVSFLENEEFEIKFGFFTFNHHLIDCLGQSCDRLQLTINFGHGAIATLAQIQSRNTDEILKEVRPWVIKSAGKIGISQFDSMFGSSK